MLGPKVYIHILVFRKKRYNDIDIKNNQHQDKNVRPDVYIHILVFWKKRYNDIHTKNNQH